MRKHLVTIGVDEENNEIKIELRNSLFIGPSGMGKTTLFRNLIYNILPLFSPNELKIIIADFKYIDYPDFGKLKHLMTPIISDPKNFNSLLEWLFKEIHHRLDHFKTNNVRSLDDRNQLYNEKIPKILIFIDSFELINQSKENKELFEQVLCLGYIVDIYFFINSLVIPLNKFIALFPNRGCFSVPSTSDSKKIIRSPMATYLENIGTFYFINDQSRKPQFIKLENIHPDSFDIFIDKFSTN